jgi:hypothetical protein
VTDQRLAAPVHRDEGEQTMLDLVPFAGAGWQVGDGYLQAGTENEYNELLAEVTRRAEHAE